MLWLAPPICQHAGRATAGGFAASGATAPRMQQQEQRQEPRRDPAQLRHCNRGLAYPARKHAANHHMHVGEDAFLHLDHRVSTGPAPSPVGPSCSCEIYFASSCSLKSSTKSSFLFLQAVAASGYVRAPERCRSMSVQWSHSRVHRAGRRLQWGGVTVPWPSLRIQQVTLFGSTQTPRGTPSLVERG